MRRPLKSDGFAEMINKDHAGAKEDPAAVIAEMICDETYLDSQAALKLARDILTWIREGDTLEG